MSECGDEVCITCSDELRSVVVESVDADGATACVRDGDERREVSIELIDGVRPGDVLLTHGGIALQRGEPAESVARRGAGA